MYDYRNVSGIRNSFNSNTFDDTAPAFRQKGNTVFNIDNDGNAATNLYALAADYRLAFGEEPGALAAIALMTDSDNTASRAQSWYGPVDLH
jgi:hypothetical protein